MRIDIVDKIPFVLSLPVLSSVAYVQELENDTVKPVVSSTAASHWWVLQTLGMKPRIEGFGKLLRKS